MPTQWIDEIKWNEQGLVPAIAQDYQTNQVLMMAWMNKEALQLTIKEQRAIYWSRSRQKIWRKGEESGHIQKLHKLYLDCDADVVLLTVEQVGHIACHTGRTSCFYRQLIHNQWVTVTEPLKPSTVIYHKG